MKHIATYVSLCLLWSPAAVGQQKPYPDINESKEYSNVIHSPSAESTPPVFRSVLQLEIAVEEENGEAAIRYANGVVVGSKKWIVCVLDQPNSNLSVERIQSADILMLDGTSVSVKVDRVDAAHGLAVFRAAGLDAPALEISDRAPVAKRRLNWHAVYHQGQKTVLYSRPLQIHKARLTIGETDTLCEVIDHESSALSAERSGSALLSLDGRLVAVMGRQPYWNVSPRSVRPRTKVSWAVPAKVILQAIDEEMQSE